MKRIILMLFVLFAQAVNGHGFEAGTLVKTAQGYVSIEKLDIGDSVCCFDDNQETTTAKIVACRKEKFNLALRIKLHNGNSLVSSKDQPFLLPNAAAFDPYQDQENLTSEGVQSCNIVLQHKDVMEEVALDSKKALPLFSSLHGMCIIDTLEFLEREITLYTITLDKYHRSIP